MQILIILVAIAACCVAAPLTSNSDNHKQPADVPLERPSPINPELPMPPKPAEKIVLITDPVEFAKHKREIVETTHHATFAQIAPTLSLTPINPTPTNDHTMEPSTSTTQQPDHQLERQKRDDQVLVDTKKVQPLKPVEKPTSTTAKPTTEAPTSSTPRRTYSSRTTHMPRKSKPITEVPTNPRQARDVETSSSQTAAVPPPRPLIFGNTASEHKVSLQIPQGPSNPTHTYAKRDIPVPLVPKHPHPEESPKESKESDESGEKKQHEVRPHEVEQKSNQQHKEDEQPSKVAVKRENVQIEALSSSAVPIPSPAEEYHQVNPTQQQDVKNTQQHHDPAASQQHANQQLHNLHHQFQHNEQTESQPHAAHNYEHHATQQHQAFQPEHPHVASTTLKSDVVTSADTASSSTSSTTEHPLFRTRPVPVAELFGRSQH